MRATPSVPLPIPRHLEVSQHGAGAVTEVWRTWTWNVYNSTFLENECCFSGATCAEEWASTTPKNQQGELWESDPHTTGRQANSDKTSLSSPNTSKDREIVKEIKNNKTEQNFEWRINLLAVNCTLEVKLNANEDYSRLNIGHTTGRMPNSKLPYTRDAISNHIPTAADVGKGEPQHYSQRCPSYDPPHNKFPTRTADN